MRKLTGAINRGVLLALCGSLLLTLPAEARVLEFRSVPAPRVERLGEDARNYYEQTLNFIDRTNYVEAMDAINKAVEADPSDVYLRQAALSLALYLGDTRQGAASVKYYEVALNHLKVMTASDRLNKREQDRAKQLMGFVSDLRNAVGERDEKRLAHGREIAKKYARIIFQGETEERESEKASRARIQQPEKQAQQASDANVQSKLQ